MPPAIFTVGTEDMLLDDTLFMEDYAGPRRRRRLDGFISLPMTVADAVLGVEHDFLRRACALTKAGRRRLAIRRRSEAKK